MGLLESCSYCHQEDHEITLRSDWRSGSLRIRRPSPKLRRRWRLSWDPVTLAAAILLERDLRENANKIQIFVSPITLLGAYVIYADATVRGSINSREHCSVEVLLEESFANP